MFDKKIQGKHIKIRFFVKSTFKKLIFTLFRQTKQPC